MVVISPPLLLGAAAWVVARLKGCRYVLHVQDLQPDAAVALGMVDGKWFIDLLRRLEEFSYRSAALRVRRQRRDGAEAEGQRRRAARLFSELGRVKPAKSGDGRFPGGEGNREG